VTCFDTGVRCLQVILTPTCRVSGYPRQVIKVATLLRQLRFICTALPTVITLITIIPLGTYSTSSWYIFLRDHATPLVHLSSLMNAVCLSLPFTDRLYWLLYWLWTSCFHITTVLLSLSFTTDCSPFITLDLLDRRYYVQLFRCCFNAFNCYESVFLFVERFPR
jgi:hypothetical protein